MTKRNAEWARGVAQSARSMALVPTVPPVDSLDGLPSPYRASSHSPSSQTDDLYVRLLELMVDTVAFLGSHRVQATARQVSRHLGQGEAFAKRALTQAVGAGMLTVSVEWIDQAKGEFNVYRPAVRVAA